MILQVLIFSLISPILLISYGTYTDRKIKIKDIKAVIVYLFSVFSCFIYCRLINNLATGYEYFLIVLSITNIFVFFIFPLLSKTFIAKNILLAIFVESVIVVSYSILTYGRVSVHSDTATGSLLANSIIKNKCIFPSSWNYANGDIWVFNLWPECLLPNIFVSSKSLARMIGSLITVYIAIVSIIYFTKTVLKNDSWLISIPVVFVFLIGTGDISIDEKVLGTIMAIPESSDMLLYQCAYTHIIICLVLILTFIYKIIFNEKNNSKKFYLISALLITLLCMGGTRYIAEITIPFFILLIMLNIFYSKTNSKKKLNCIVLLIISSCVGYVIYIWLASWHNMNLRVVNEMVFGSSIEVIFDNVIKAFSNILALFGFYPNVGLMTIQGIMNMVFIFSCFIFIYFVPCLIARKIRKYEEEINYFVLFVFVHFFVFLMVVILLSKMMPHYLLTSVILSIILSSSFIYNYFSKKDNILCYVCICAFCLCSIIQMIGLLQYSNDWTKILKRNVDFENKLIDLGVSKAYSQYWNAYTNEIYSDFKIKTGALYIDTEGRINSNNAVLRPYYWLCEDDVFNDDGNIKTALLLNEEEKESLSDKFSIDESLGVPIDEYFENNLYVYIFDHDIAYDFYNEIDDNIIRPSENLFVEGGVKEHNQIQINPFGCSSGPYIPLKKGEYKININGYNVDLSEISFYSNNYSDRKIIKRKDNISTEVLTYYIDVPCDIPDFEVQIYNPSQEKNIYIYGIEIYPINERIPE